MAIAARSSILSVSKTPSAWFVTYPADGLTFRYVTGVTGVTGVTIEFLDVTWRAVTYVTPVTPLFDAWRKSARTLATASLMAVFRNNFRVQRVDARGAVLNFLDSQEP